MKNKILIVLLSVFSLTFCMTQKKKDRICTSCPSKTIRVDSIVIKTEKRDTTIYITQNGYSIYYQPCDSLGKIKPFKPIVKNKNGVVTTLSQNNGVLECNCKDDSLKIVIEGLNSIVSRTQVVSETETIETKVNVLTKLQGFWIISGQILWCVVLLFFGWKVIKYYRKMHLPI